MPSQTDGQNGYDSWQWVVTAGCGLWLAANVGMMKSMGLLYIEFIEQFEATPSETAVFASTFSICQSITAPLAGVVSNRYDMRYPSILASVTASLAVLSMGLVDSFTAIIILFGITGLGAGFGMTGSLVMLGQHAKFLPSVAFSLAAMLSSIGGLTLPILITKGASFYGYRGSLFLVAGVYLQTVLAGATFKPVEGSKDKENTGFRSTKESTLDEERKHNCMALGMNKDFWIVLLGFTFASAYNVMFMFLPPFTLEKGFTEFESSVVVSLISVTEVISRPVSGWLVAYFRLTLSTVCGVTSLCSCIVAIIMTLLPYRPVIFGFAVVFGLTGGVFLMYSQPIMRDAVPPALGSIAGSLLPPSSNIGRTAFPPLAGLMKEMSGTYTLSVQLISLTYIPSSVLLFLRSWRKKRKHRRELNVEIDVKIEEQEVS